MEVPIDSGPFAGYICGKDEWDEMLDRLYTLHGWDPETGLQTRTCLEDLGLEDVVPMVAESGRLIER